MVVVMVRTQISMTASQAEALRRLAARRRTSQAALLREAIDLLVRAESQASRIDRARAAVGVGASGLTSISVDHDAALSDAFAE